MGRYHTNIIYPTDEHLSGHTHYARENEAQNLILYVYRFQNTIQTKVFGKVSQQP